MPAGELGHTKSEQPVANHGLLFGGVHHDLLHSRHGSLKDPDGEHRGAPQFRRTTFRRPVAPLAR